ncbi:MAG TPA: aldehyde dehydrogenase family protein, partial [Thermoanaerobaculia bacterium]
PLRERARAIDRVRREIYARRDLLATTLQREIGKPAFDALFEVLITADSANYAARQAPRAFRTRSFQPWYPAMLRKRVEIHWEPYGVVGVIAPWNYPYLLAGTPTFSALVAGNAVVLKPSEMAPSCGAVLVEAVRAAGIPADLIHCIQGDGTTGRLLIESGIDRLFFTGSEATGRKVAAACGERLIPVSLELGGSDPAIVLEDADPATAAAGIVWGRFANAGQTCAAPKRVFAVGTIYDRLVEELKRAVEPLRVGGPDREVAPLIRPSQADALASQRRDALERGARTLAKADPRVTLPSSAAAEILVDVDDRMRVMREETFGPLLPVVRVASVEEAIAKANASPFGLSASIWTSHPSRGVAIARRLEAGTVMVNDVVAEAAMADVPHGGFKSSGIGRMHGIIGLTEAAQPKTVIIDRFHRWRQAWWFPYTDRMLAGMGYFFDFLHGRGVVKRAIAGTKATWLLYVGKK